jgi:hypothetical protein
MKVKYKTSKFDFSGGGNMNTDIIKKLEEKRQKYLGYRDELIQQAAHLEQRNINAQLYLKYKQKQKLTFWKDVLGYTLAVIAALGVFYILQVYIN